MNKIEHIIIHKALYYYIKKTAMLKKSLLHIFGCSHNGFFLIQVK